MKKILFVVLVLAFVPVYAKAANDHVWINQVQVAGDNGATDEFTELFNPTSASVSINGWSIQYKSATGSFPLTSGKKNLPDATIPPLGYYLIAHADYNGTVVADHVQSTISLSGASSGATFFLVNDTNFLTSGTDATIVDKLGYGTSITNSPETANALAPASEQALMRSQDTDNNAADFTIISSNPHNLASSPVVPAPTPAPVPSPTPTPAPTPIGPQYSQAIIISEFLPNPDGSDSGEEWVELYNSSEADVDLSGWILDDESSDGSIGSSAYTIPDGSMILARSFLVVDLPEGSFALNNTGGDTLRLLWPNNIQVTTLTYSETAKVDESFAQRFLGIYEWTAFPTQGAANQFVEASVKGISSQASSQIKINEIFPNPKGTDGGEEWVELVNTGDQPIYLHDWILDDGEPGSPMGVTAWKIQSPIVPPLGFAVLMIPSGKFALNNTEDHVRLFNENEVLIDLVSYHEAQEDRSYAWVDGQWLWGSPTPNAANKQVLQPISTELPNIVISELFPEPKRGSNQEEFIELQNLGQTDQDLSGFKIADLATSYTLQGVIKLGEFLVIKKSESNISFNNTGNETVTLIDQKGQMVASLSYEDAPIEQSYNFTASGTYVWSMALTPGKENKIVAISEVKISPVSQTKVATKSSDIQTPAIIAVAEPAPVLQDGQVSGVNIESQPDPNPLKNLWLWLLGSFALNLLFCYSLVKLMIKRTMYE